MCNSVIPNCNKIPVSLYEQKCAESWGQTYLFIFCILSNSWFERFRENWEKGPYFVTKLKFKREEYWFNHKIIHQCSHKADNLFENQWILHVVGKINFVTSDQHFIQRKISRLNCPVWINLASSIKTRILIKRTFIRHPIFIEFRAFIFSGNGSKTGESCYHFYTTGSDFFIIIIIIYAAGRPLLDVGLPESRDPT